jgi:hypothetical protein
MQSKEGLPPRGQQTQMAGPVSFIGYRAFLSNGGCMTMSPKDGLMYALFSHVS